MSDIRKSLCSGIVNPDYKEQGGSKITVVGVGQVGMAAAFSIMLQGVANDLALVDVVADKLEGELMDMQHGTQFIRRCNIQASTDYKITANSTIVVLTAGCRQREGESRLNLVQRNVDIFKGIVPQIVKYSPNCIIVVVSNPVDILTYVTWKLSGLPKHRVIGSGTMLDSARFRFLLSEKLAINPSSCHGYIIGEHGDTSVAVWSSVNIGGVSLVDIQPNIGTDKDPDNLAEVHKEVIDSAYKIIKLKGYTSWAIGCTVSSLCAAIVKNQHSVHAVSTVAQGFHGITEEVYLSLPSIVCSQGINGVVRQKLNATEVAQLQKSASTLADVIKGIKW